jgi:3-deoxy-D-manno-octulosonate 8-phosphate phosphatase (KDO 8-P phosphatase)
LPKIRLLILDVDGVLTTGALSYGAEGEAAKVFYVQDGAALRQWQAAGGRVALISGRQSEAVTVRAKELGIESVVQGVSEKMAAYETVCREAGVSDAETSFVGDDELDLAPMRRCGYPIAVANATPRVKRAARYVTRRGGGGGAASEVVERLLRHNERPAAEACSKG